MLEFFIGLGIEICEAWGMSETTGVGAINRPGEARIGSVENLLSKSLMWPHSVEVASILCKQSTQMPVLHVLSPDPGAHGTPTEPSMRLALAPIPPTTSL